MIQICIKRKMKENLLLLKYFENLKKNETRIASISKNFYIGKLDVIFDEFTRTTYQVRIQGYSS